MATEDPISARSLTETLFVIINIIFMICGISILALGCQVKIFFENNVFEVFGADSDLVMSVNMLIIVAISLGCFIFLVSLLGCASPCWRVLVPVYAVVMIIILIAEIAVIPLYGNRNGDNENSMGTNLFDGLQGYHEAAGKTSEDKLFDAFFHTFQCCGVDTYTDFQSRVSDMNWDSRNHNHTIPVTCCRDVNYNRIDDADFAKACITNPTSDNAYIKGCYSTLLDVLDKNKTTAVGFCVGIILLQILVVILAFLIFCRIDDSEESFVQNLSSRFSCFSDYDD